MTPVWLSISAAAERAMVSPRTIRVWMHKGLAHARLSNNVVRIHVDAMDAFISQHLRTSIGVDEEIDHAIKKARKVAKELMLR